jgi:hypothetical protein
MMEAAARPAATGEPHMQRRSLALASLGLLALVLQTAPAAAQDYYGAIAYSNSNGAMGWAYDHRSRAAAENDALARCSGSCRIAIWFRNACAAIATSPDHAYGTGWSTSRREAEGIAMNVCRQHSGNCSVERWICTTR